MNIPVLPIAVLPTPGLPTLVLTEADLSRPPAFACGLRRYGDAVALVTGTAEVSYAALADRADGFAARLGAGVGRKLVVLEAAPAVEFVAAYLGALAGGHAVALVAGEDVAGFRARFAPDATYARQGGRWRLVLDGRGMAGREASGRGVEGRFVPALHPDLALVLMTSGSTGQGKAVRLSARAVEQNAAAIAGYLGLTGAERAALVLPMHYSFGVSVLNSHLSVGASVWLAEGGLLAAGFLEALAAKRATSLSTVPHGYEVLARIGFEAAVLPDLKTLAVAGGALPVARMRAAAAGMVARGGRFFAMYGQTEATARIAYVPPARALVEERPGLIGRPVPGGRLWLRGGELVYDGPGVMMGYAATRADLARGSEVTALATGDLAVEEADGLFRITGRARRMSKIAGLRIGHDAVEAGLAARGIVAAVGGDDASLRVVAEGDGEAAAAVALTVAALTGLTGRHVAVRPVAALPRLVNGKVDYAALDAVRKDGADAGLVQVFAQVFQPQPVREGDSFASLGGDSLRHVEVAMVLEQRLGHLPDGWERMALRDLVALQGVPAPRQASVDTALVLRALAVLAVVITHETQWPLYGGAAVMVVLVGLMLARFQRGAMAAGDLRHLLRPLGRVLVPYYAIVAGYAVAWGQVPWGSALLVSNFGIGAPATFDRVPFLYWFVEAFAQMFVLLAVLVALPPVRRLIGRDPFRFGLWFLGGAVALRFAFPLVWDIGGQRIFTLAWVLYLAALGWLVALADTRHRRLAVLALAVPVLASAAYWGGNWFGAWTKYATVFGAVALLLYAPQMRLPRRAVRPVLAVAGASYLVYLTHRFVPNLMLAPLGDDLPGWLFSALSIGGGILLGLAAFAAQRALLALWARPSSLLHPCKNTLGVRG